MSVRILWVVAAVLLIQGYGSVSVGQVPDVLHYQGRLMIGDDPASGTHNLRFALYPVQEGGTPIWSEVHEVNVVEGIFDVLLGGTAPISEPLFEAAAPLYMGIGLESEAEMTPRLRVAGSAFTIRAARADGVAPGAVGAPGLAAAAVTTAKLADGAVTQAKLADDAAVRSLNGQRGDVALEAGSNVSLVEEDGTIVISATGGSSGGDITSVNAGSGLSGGGTTADVTLAIADGGVTAAHLAENAVTSSKIDDAAVNASKLADAAVITGKVASAAVTTGKLADEAVTTAKLADEAVTGAKLGGGSVEASHIADGAVTGAKLSEDAAVRSLNEQSGDVILAPGENISIEEEDGTITISSSGGGGGLITSVSAGDGLSGGGTVGDLTLGLADGGVTTEKLAGGSVTAGKLAGGSVIADKLANGSVTTEKLADGSVTTDELANGSVITEKLGDLAVSTETIANASVTTAKLADGAVTETKLAADAAVLELNGLAGSVTLAEGKDVIITESGSTITIGVHDNGKPSSRRWKTEIRRIEDAVSIVQQLRGVWFEWTESGKPDMGLIAEEVAAVIPEIVEFDPDDGTPTAVHYDQLVALLIEAIKVQERQAITQQADIDELMHRVERLEEQSAAARAEPTAGG